MRTKLRPAESDSAGGDEPVREAPGPSVRTADERLSELDHLPSLAEPTVLPPEKKTVDPMAFPPPAPVALIEPKPSGQVDKGQPVPEHYAMDRVRAMPRDAEWIYVYWELKGGALDRLRFQRSADIIDNSRWVLRVRTPQGRAGAGSEHLVDVDLRAGKWWLKVAPGTLMIVDLGYVDHNGEFVLVVRGNELSTPRPAVSPVVDEQWMILREELERLLEVTGVGEDSSSSQVSQFKRSELPRAIGLFSARVLDRKQGDAGDR